MTTKQFELIFLDIPQYHYLINEPVVNINDFNMRIGSSSNVLIATLRENSFILAGPLRQKWITSVYTIYN